MKLYAIFVLFMGVLAAAIPVVTVAESSNSTELDRRFPLPAICNVQDFNPAYGSDAFELAKRLRKRGGRCHVGPRSCEDIMCYGTAFAKLCNDRYDLIAPNCDYMANYIEQIVWQCPTADPDWKYYTGQQFDTDNYNVILRGPWEFFEGTKECREKGNKYVPWF